MLRIADQLSDREVANLIKDCFADIRAAYDRPFSPTSNEPWLERDEQHFLANEHLAELERQIDRAEFSTEVSRLSQELVHRKNLSFDESSPERQLAIKQGVARVLIEADRCFIHRLNDSVSPHKPSDPLFAHSPRDLSERVGLTVDELVSAYMRSHKAVWAPKTYRTHAPKLQLLADYLGGDRLADGITRKDLVHFPDELLRLRRNHHATEVPSFHSRQTDNPKMRIMPSTATGILARAIGLFSWGFEKGYITTNPAQKLSVTVPKTKKGLKGRRPFTPGELQALFSAPLFTGCRSFSRRYETGEAHVRDDQFWLPILGYLTGARLGELIQLHFSDCRLDEEYPHLSINEDGPERPGDPDFKHVKTEAGVRLIPLHPDLFTLGFSDFVKRQKKYAGKNKRLFWRIKYGADGHPSTSYSKKFGRLLDKIDLGDPALVFHSFRHTTIDAFRNSNTSKYAVDEIIGHRDQSAAAQYGQGVSLQVLWETVADLTLPLSLPALLGAQSKP